MSEKKSFWISAQPGAIPLSLRKVLVSRTVSLNPYLENANNLRSRPPDVKVIWADIRKVPFFWVFLKKSKIVKSDWITFFITGPIKIFKKLIKINNNSTKKMRFGHFYVLKSEKFGKSGIFEIDFSAWRG